MREWKYEKDEISKKDVRSYAGSYSLLLFIFLIIISIVPVCEKFTCRNQICEQKIIYAFKPAEIEQKPRPSYVKIVRSNNKKISRYNLEGLCRQTFSLKQAQKAKELILSSENDISIANREYLKCFLILFVILGISLLSMVVETREKKELRSYWLEIVAFGWVSFILFILLLFFKN